MSVDMRKRRARVGYIQFSLVDYTSTTELNSSYVAMRKRRARVLAISLKLSISPCRCFEVFEPSSL